MHSSHLSPEVCNDRKYARLFLGLLSFTFFFRLAYLLWAGLELSEDEAYYWEWSRQLDWSYYSKGPMVAYLIRLGTLLFGNTEFGVRAPALLLSTIAMPYVFLLSQALFRETRTAFFCALVFCCVPVFNVGSTLLTIDNPVFCFWTAACYHAWMASETQSPRHWLAAGAALGLGLMTKAVIFFFIPSLLLFLWWSRPRRALLRTPWPWLCIVTGLVFFVPQIVWNYRHDFVMFRDFLHKGGQGRPLNLSVMSPIKFIASQAGIISPLLFILVVWGMAGAVRRAVRQQVEFLFCAAFFAPVTLFYLALSLKTKTNPNWMIIAYLTPLLAGTQLFWNSWRRASAEQRFPARRGLAVFGAAALLTGLAASAVLYCTGALYTSKRSWFKPELDPTNRLYGWRQLASHVDSLKARYSGEGRVFYAGAKYQFPAVLAFYGKDNPVTYCLNGKKRSNQYYFLNDYKKILRQDAIFVAGKEKETDCLEDYFEKVTRLEDFPVKRGEYTVKRYQIFFCKNFKTPLRKNSAENGLEDD